MVSTSRTCLWLPVSVGPAVGQGSHAPYLPSPGERERGWGGERWPHPGLS